MLSATCEAIVNHRVNHPSFFQVHPRTLAKKETIFCVTGVCKRTFLAASSFPLSPDDLPSATGRSVAATTATYVISKTCIKLYVNDHLRQTQGNEARPVFES